MSKTIPPVCPEPETGRRYWRSLDQLAETPEFRQWLEREFPQGASEFTDEVSRRHFVKIMSASFLLAGLGLGATGCRRPVERLEPFGKQPEGYVHGVPQFFATAMPTRSGAVPLVAKSYEGRPIKVEGNPLHPDSNGGTDRWSQASILNLYDPDRSRRFTKGGTNVAPEAAFDFLKELSASAQRNGGQGLVFLLERNTSPSRQRLQQVVARKFPQAKWFVHEAIDTDIHRRAASEAFGASVKPYFHYDKAKVILSLDCDFIGAEEDVHNNIRKFVDGRRIETPKSEMNRLYVVEALMTLTGVNADHRLRTASSKVGAIAAAILTQLNGGQAQVPAGVNNSWITECAADLKAHAGRSLVVAGYRQPLEVHLLAHAINAALNNIGQTVVLHETPAFNAGSLAELAQALNAGQIETLVMLGGNPAYTAPADLDWLNAQAKAKSVVRLGYYEDESFQITKRANDWHFPAAHYLESWGDVRTSDGTLVPIQPLIAPLFGGVTEIEILARIAGEEVVKPYDIVRQTFAQAGGSADDLAWTRFLHDGFLQGSAAKPASARANAGALSQAASRIQAGNPSRDSLEVVFHRDYSLDDGRFTNNGWLQELPDPITKFVWDNAVLISRKTARELGVKNSDVVEVKLGNRSLRGPIWIQPGMADYTIGLALGYGRELAGRVGSKVGFNAYAIRSATAGDIVVGATVAKTSDTYPIACTQDHWSMEGRPLVREGTLQQYSENSHFVKNMDGHQPPGGNRSLYPNPFDKDKERAHHQWGMAIDLGACVGCATCTIACQSENNIPIVGKDLVSRGREMHWLRIDRYYAGPAAMHRWESMFTADTYKNEDQQQFEEWIDDPQVVTQPMLCQHCESAPCENVCPVNATVHDQEGLNVMVYNRCVGTRYCSNNCPYKVRRFNYLDYNKRPLKDLKGPFYPPSFANGAFSKWVKDPTDPTAGMREEDEWDLIKMMKNPDVTVRMRGVMEKCTFCVQRIEGAKIAQKVKAGASGDVIVPDGTFTTACAQACPAGAIVFGDINDANSKVSKLKAQERNYSVLDFLLTKPRTTYLARLRNPNPRMPDYADPATEYPLSLDEYKMRNGDPFGHHGEHGAAEAGTGASVEKGHH
ncbi:MAG TPA: TAT-variant-translocated molybdopterin oxidoreductase [Verrucomicrobiae bacterium]|nr:TAT-variant-translocated molybdopterin oxidoreductase [Verrucomicrobiae bacterium]